MIADSKYIIKNQTLEFRFTDQEKARKAQDDLIYLFNAKVNPAIEKICQQHDVKGSVISIESLELDLGVVPPDQLADEVVARVEKLLEAELSKRIYYLTTNSPIRNNEDSLHQLQQESEETWFYFLRNGALPWNSRYELSDLKKSFISKLKENPNPLLNRLRKQLHRHEIRRRLIYQFDEKKLLLIIRAVFHGEQSKVVQLKRAIEKFLIRHKLSASYASVINNVFYEAMLQYAAISPGQTASHDTLTDCFVKNLIGEDHSFSKGIALKTELTDIAGKALLDENAEGTLESAMIRYLRSDSSKDAGNKPGFSKNRGVNVEKRKTNDKISSEEFPEEGQIIANEPAERQLYPDQKEITKGDNSVIRKENTPGNDQTHQNSENKSDAFSNQKVTDLSDLNPKFKKQDPFSKEGDQEPEKRLYPKKASDSPPGKSQNLSRQQPSEDIKDALPSQYPKGPESSHKKATREEHSSDDQFAAEQANSNRDIKGSDKSRLRKGESKALKPHNSIGNAEGTSDRNNSAKAGRSGPDQRDEKEEMLLNTEEESLSPDRMMSSDAPGLQTDDYENSGFEKQGEKPEKPGGERENQFGKEVFTTESERDRQQHSFRNDNNGKPQRDIDKDKSKDLITSGSVTPISDSQENLLWSERVPDLSEAYIENAGLVLLQPFLPSLFKGMEWADKDDFFSEEKRERAAVYLQYLATGKEEWEENEMVLNKLLTGISPETPINTDIHLTGEERSEAAHLLQVVIDNWKVLKGTRPDGLRQTFLMRQGHLTKDFTGWKLQVHRNTLDVLLNKLPWSYSIIKMPWIKNMIYVEW